MFKKITTALLGSALILILTSSATFAEEAKSEIKLQVSPVSNRITLKPGEKLEYALTVENAGQSKFTYTAKAAPYSVTNEQYDVNFSKDTPRTQLSRWITFRKGDGTFANEASYTINPGEKQIVNYLVSTPESVPAGGQYAVVFITPENKSNEGGIHTVPQAGQVVYGRTIGGETKQASEITDYGFDTFLTSGRIKIRSKIKNTGNTDFVTNHLFRVSSLFGKTVYEKTEFFDILPDTERLIEADWDKTPFIGVFKVNYKVTALDSTRDETRIVIIMPAFIIIIMLILLTSLIVWSIILFRKRSQSKSKLIA